MLKSEKGQVVVIVLIVLLIILVGVLLTMAIMGVDNCAITPGEVLQAGKNFCNQPVVPVR